MTFSNLEMAAIVRIAKQMANADGRFSESEVNKLLWLLGNFDVNAIESAADSMTGYDAAAVLAKMSQAQKMYVCCYLANFITADGRIDDAEIKVWQFVGTMADFPNITFGQALESWKHM